MRAISFFRLSPIDCRAHLAWRQNKTWRVLRSRLMQDPLPAPGACRCIDNSTAHPVPGCKPLMARSRLLFPNSSTSMKNIFGTRCCCFFPGCCHCVARIQVYTTKRLPPGPKASPGRASTRGNAPQTSAKAGARGAWGAVQGIAALLAAATLHVWACCGTRPPVWIRDHAHTSFP